MTVVNPRMTWPGKLTIKDPPEGNSQLLYSVDFHSKKIYFSGFRDVKNNFFLFFLTFMREEGFVRFQI